MSIFSCGLFFSDILESSDHNYFSFCYLHIKHFMSLYILCKQHFMYFYNTSPSRNTIIYLSIPLSLGMQLAIWVFFAVINRQLNAESFLLNSKLFPWDRSPAVKITGTNKRWKPQIYLLLTHITNLLFKIVEPIYNLTRRSSAYSFASF